MASTSGLRLYRCVRTDGNPLAPRLSLDSSPNRDGLSSRQDAADQPADQLKAQWEAAKLALHEHSCLTAQQSAVACGDQHVLCEISSPSVRAYRALAFSLRRYAHRSRESKGSRRD